MTMKTVDLGKTGIKVPAISMGCMRMVSLSDAEAERFIGSCVNQGANFFDHADIYGGGRCEEIFARGFRRTGLSRDKIILQSKCGIRRDKRPISFDFSKAHIIKSVEGILSRLNTDYLDVLLLHRPDILVEPAEVAEAFSQLREQGKVLHFGVSNQNPYQMQLLQKALPMPLAANQLQFGLGHNQMAAQGVFVNMNRSKAIDRDGGVLDFCRLSDITVQAWSPFQAGFFGGVIFKKLRYARLNQKLKEYAKKYNVSPAGIALAWILRHPADMQAVVGTMSIGHAEDCIKATDINLSHEEWYTLLALSGVRLP